MSFTLSLPSLIPIVNGTLSQDGHFPDKTSQMVKGINTDSRTIQPGEVFVALEGETFDGHAFLPQVYDAGAIAAVVRYIPPEVKHLGLALIQVSDTLVAYQAIAHWWRHELQLPVIAITGSVGKTTTKELIASVLSLKGPVLKTQSNYNNEIGVPKTLLQINQTHDYAVVEMGMRGLGEIAELTDIATPNIGVITNVGTAHIGRLGSEAAIAQAKCELLEHLPASGIAILNADNSRLIDRATQVWQGKIMTYGLTKGDVQGTLLEGDRIQVTGLGQHPIDIPLPLTGPHNAVNFLAALTVAKALNLDCNWLESQLKEGLQVILPSGRAKTTQLPNDVTILDETYNAGFESMTAALRLLKTTTGKRHIAVLGTMKELGDWSISLHHRVGQTVKALGIDQLFILADPDESQALAQGAEGIPSRRCESKLELLAALEQSVMSGDRILFKASRSVGLDEVVEQFRIKKSISVP